MFGGLCYNCYTTLFRENGNPIHEKSSNCRYLRPVRGGSGGRCRHRVQTGLRRFLDQFRQRFRQPQLVRFLRRGLWLGFRRFLRHWIKGKLSVGLSLSTLDLSHGKRPANTDEDFLGNINELTKESSTQVFPTLNYLVCDYFTLGVSYVKIEARTKNFNNLESDGNATLKGPVFTAEAAYPLWKELVIPHAGVGVATMSGDFKEDSWWHAGYSSPEDYESVGRDNNRYRRHRYIDVDDDSCAFFAIGVSCRPAEHLLLDVSYRKLSLMPDCVFGYESKGRKSVMRTGDFDMSCDVVLFSVSYLF